MTELLLTPFAALIQLWAGICLLFLYESLLTKSPISSFQNKNKELFLPKKSASSLIGLLIVGIIES